MRKEAKTLHQAIANKGVRRYYHRLPKCSQLAESKSFFTVLFPSLGGGLGVVVAGASTPVTSYVPLVLL